MARTDPSTLFVSPPLLLSALVSLVLASTLQGCTVFVPRDSPLPRDGATMEQIYQRHGDGSDDAATGLGAGAAQTPRDRVLRRTLAEDDEVMAQRRRLSEPLNNRFERLPNPDLVMRVFPHLAQGRYPVPGYDTVFPMYEGVAYALPGEVAPRHQRSGSFTAPEPATGRLPAPAEPATRATGAPLLSNPAPLGKDAK